MMHCTLSARDLWRWNKYLEEEEKLLVSKQDFAVVKQRYFVTYLNASMFLLLRRGPDISIQKMSSLAAQGLTT